MTNETSQPSSPQRYGWVIVGVLLMIQTVSSGLGFYNMSVYINRLSAELAVPISDVSFAVSLFFVAGGVAGLYIAALLTRFKVRTIMIAGTLLAGLALGLVGIATEVWHVYGLFALFGCFTLAFAVADWGGAWFFLDLLLFFIRCTGSYDAAL